MKKRFYFILGWAGILFAACASRDAAVRVEENQGEKLYVCDYYKVQDRPTELKLSDLVDSLEIIKLANDTNAIIGYGPVYLSENYMLLRPDWKSPLKLFDRKGNYLNDVGTIGRGPGEYTTVYDMQIDEENGRIYLLPWTTYDLYAYDIKGKFIETIRLAGLLPKGKFEVKDGQVKAVALPFPKTVKWAAFCQTLDGKLLDSVPALPYLVPADYSNEIYGDRFNSSVYFFTWKAKQDSLYHYEGKNNRLLPCFTVDFGGVDKIPLHDLHELGDYYWFTTSKVVQIEKNAFTTKPEKSVLVDKKKRTATSSFSVNNDFLGYDISLWSFANGYYTENVNPLTLKEKLSKAAEREDLEPEVRKRIEKLLTDIEEEGNNYIIIGKLKKEGN